MSDAKRLQVRFTAAEVAEMCCEHINDDNSGEDSETGGISSGEEFELDRELDEDFSDSDDNETE